MQHSTHFQIVSAWIDSCITVEQMDNVFDFITSRLKTDDKTHDDLIAYWQKRNLHRSWTSSKVALTGDWTRLTDEQAKKGDLKDSQPATNTTNRNHPILSKQKSGVTNSAN